MKLFRRTYSAIAGFVICVSIVQWVNWTAYAIEPDLYVWTALPIVLLLAMLASLFVRPGKLIAILTAIGGTSVLLVWCAVSAGAYTWIIPLSEVTGVWKYESALRRYPDKSLTEHFPPAIPEDAYDVGLSYVPAWRDRPASLELRFKTTPQHLGELTRRYSGRAVACAIPEKFDDRYESICLGPVEAGRADADDHQPSAGIALRRQSKQIVYWAKSW